MTRGAPDLRGSPLIASEEGISFGIADRRSLDRHSRALLGRFL
jgi:hypothetical protein